MEISNLTKLKVKTVVILTILIFFSACSSLEHVGNSQLEHVTFLLDWAPNSNHTGLYVAQKLGYYKAEGLEIEIKRPPENSIIPLVAAGKADFGIDFQDSIAPALVQNLPIKTVAAISNHNTWGILSPKSADITSPKDLCGKKMSTWNLPTEQAILKYIVEKDGGNFSEVDQLLCTATDFISAFQTDSVSAVWGYYPQEKIEADYDDCNLETNFIYVKDSDPVLDFYAPIIITSSDLLNKNPEKVRAFLRAISKGYEFAAKNPEKASEILFEFNPELNKKTTYYSQKYMSSQYIGKDSKFGYIDADRWNNFYRFLWEKSVIKAPLAENAGFTNDFLPGG